MARNLNNETRNELAVKLAAMAMKKHGAGMGRLATSIKSRLTERHSQLLTRLAPELSTKRWAELIQEGVVTGFGGRDELHFWSPDPRAASGRRRSPIRTDEIVNLSKEPGRSVEDPPRHQRLINLYTALRGITGYSAALDLTYPYERTRSIAPRIVITSLSQPALPPAPGCATLDPRVPEDAKLLKDIQAFAARLHKLLHEGFSYLEECHLLLLACRTEKQLEDLFPEAAKLLPPPPAPRSNVAPVELAARVRKMLETGVPEE